MSIRWTSKPLGEFLTFQRGYDITKKEQKEGPYKVISSSGPKSSHSEYKVKGPGVIIGRKGTLGSVFYTKENYWPHDTSLWVKNFHGNDPLFSYYFLHTMGFEKLDVGAANPSLNRNHIHTIPVTLPPLAEQKRIAGILSAYDDLIENNLRRIKILEDMAQSLYREWFVHFRYPGHESTKLIDSPQGPIPQGWDSVPMPEAVEARPKLPVPKDDEIPFVPMGSLAEGSMLIGERETRAKASGARFQNGDTLFARITPCLQNGKTGYVQFLEDDSTVCCGSTEFIVLRSKTVCPEYVYLMSRSSNFRENAIQSMSGATGRQRVREECFRNFLLAQPPQDLIDKFQSIVKPQFELIYKLNTQNTNLRTTRDLLLPKLLTPQ